MSPEQRTEQAIGTILPDFALSFVTPPHGPWRLHEMAARGRGAVLVFWSSVCSHCARYDRYLNEFSEQHPELAFAAIASRQDETADDVRAALAARGLVFPTLYDTGTAVARQLFTQQTPRAFLVDAESRLVYRGAIDNFKYPEDNEYEAYLEPAVVCLLAGRPIPRADTPSFGCAIASVYYTIPRPLKRV
ncbi:MAG TPA: redoxin family protein [Vicinamibacterales bacterium]|nr:redoxin family protein [Vicinamibacterales bacterium]